VLLLHRRMSVQVEVSNLDSTVASEEEDVVAQVGTSQEEAEVTRAVVAAEVSILPCQDSKAPWVTWVVLTIASIEEEV
jgi:hypothetical protein